MKFYLTLIWFLYSLVSISQIEKDTIIEITGNNINNYSRYATSSKIGNFISNGQLQLMGLLDTNLQFEYIHPIFDGNFEVGILPDERIVSSKENEYYLGIKKSNNNYIKWTKNAFKIPAFKFFWFSSFLILSPYFHSRDSIQNLFIQKLNYKDSLIQFYTIQNSQNYGFCHLGNETTNGLIPYLLTAKDSGGYYEFGYFDSVFNRLDTFRFKHPTEIPNKGERFLMQEIFINSKNKLSIGGYSNLGIPTYAVTYKLTFDLNTKNLESVWYNQKENMFSTYFGIRANKIQFDQWGNLFFVGRADTKKDESWNNWHGFVQMVDTNNILLVDTLYKFNPATNNETDFIYHLGGGRVILGGHYNYNTGITPAAWYKKFNIKDWYLPTVGMEEKETKENQFLVYPNPTNSIIKIDGPINDIAIVTITDIQGKVILEKTYSEQIDISKFHDGIYFLTVKLKNGKTEIYKIVK